MKKVIYFLGICTLILSMTACKSTGEQSAENGKTADNSQNSLEWQGVYNGTIPCADCPGIETVVVLNSDNTYKMTSRYITGEDNVFEYAGKLQWSKDGGSVTLEGTDKQGGTTRLKVGENKLFWLDNEGKEITGDLADKYILNRVDSELVEKYWKVVELFGKPIEEGAIAKDAYMTLRTMGNRVNGNLGCNTFSGSYETKGLNRISFSKVASTMMMCMNMDVENKMKDVLNQADSYYAKNDTLVLNRARMAPLARFVAVYMD